MVAALLTVAIGTRLTAPVTADGPANRVQLVRLLAQNEKAVPGPVTLPDGLQIAATRIGEKGLVFDVTVTNPGKKAVACSLDLRVTTGGPRMPMSRIAVIPREILKQPVVLGLAPGEKKVIRFSPDSPVYRGEVASLMAVVDGEPRLVAELGPGTATRGQG
jgi:hypothetical protein